MKISACVITKNEAKNIARCLESIRTIVDEIIVVDTGSNDQTVDIARQIGAKIYFFEWINDFAAARNFALDYAKGDWIIFLDADEYFIQDSVRKIKPYLQKVHKLKNIDGVSCKMSHLDVNGKVVSYHPTVRIFRNLKSIRYEGRIHEHPQKDGRPLNTAWDPHGLEIFHTGYAGANLANKIQRNLKLLEDNLENNRGPLAYFYVGASYALQGKREEAIHYARLSLEKDRVEITPFAYKPYVIIATSMIMLREKYSLDDIREVLTVAIAKHPDHPELWAVQGSYYKICKQYSKALEAYLHALKCNENYKADLANEFLSVIGEVYYEIGALYVLMNKSTYALDFFVKALSTNNHNDKAFCELITTIRTQNPEDIIYLLNSIYDTKNEKDIAFLVQQLSILKQGKVLAYYHHFWQEVFNHNDLTTLITIIANGRYDRAAELFRAYYLETKDPQGQLFSVAAALLAENVDFVKYNDFLELPYKNIGHAYLTYSNNNISLTDGETQIYLEILTEFAYLGSVEQIVRMVALKEQFPRDLTEQIGDLFYQHRFYQQALAQYANILERKHDISAQTAFRSGICLFRLGDYLNAIEYWSIALKNGYYEDDIFDYLQWAAQQSMDIEVTAMVDKLLSNANHNKPLIFLSESDGKGTEETPPDTSNNTLEEYVKAFRRVVGDLISNGKLEEAKVAIQEFEAIVPNDCEVISMKAIILMLENQFDEAEYDLRQGLIAFPNQFDLLYNLGYLYQIKDNRRLAIGYYTLALIHGATDEVKVQLKQTITELNGALVDGYKNPSRPLVSIVILAYNNLEYTKLCIDSIYRYTMNIDYELITVDNGSSDGTKEFFNSLPNIKKIYLEKNVGPVNGFNAGLKVAEGKYTAGVCNDFIFTTNWLSNLVCCMESDEQIGFVSPGSSNISNGQQINGTYTNQLEMQQFANEYNVSDPRKWEERVRLLPNVLMVRTELFNKIGYYDPRFYFGEFADDDYAFRIRRAGFKLMFLRDTFVFHFGSVTTKEDQRKHNSLEVSRNIFYEKHGIDAWDDASFNPHIVDAVSAMPRNKIKILGANTACGGTPLQIKNRLKERGVSDIELWNITDDEKYLADLQTVSNYAALTTIASFREMPGQPKFDIIVWERGFEKVDSILKTLSNLKELLAKDGQIIIRADNPSYYGNILYLLNGMSMNKVSPVSSYLNKNEFVKLIESTGFKKVEALGCKYDIPPDGHATIQALVNLGIAYNKPLAEDILSVAYYLYRIGH